MRPIANTKMFCKLLEIPFYIRIKTKCIKWKCNLVPIFSEELLCCGWNHAKSSIKWNSNWNAYQTQVNNYTQDSSSGSPTEVTERDREREYEKHDNCTNWRRMQIKYSLHQIINYGHRTLIIIECHIVQSILQSFAILRVLHRHRRMAVVLLYISTTFVCYIYFMKDCLIKSIGFYVHWGEPFHTMTSIETHSESNDDTIIVSTCKKEWNILHSFKSTDPERNCCGYDITFRLGITRTHTHK